RLVDEVTGAMRILDLSRPAAYLTGIRMFAQSELLGRKRIPASQQLDTLADALASMEYYLEALRDQRPHRDEILDIAGNSLESLGYWPLPEPMAASEPELVDQAPEPVAAPALAPVPEAPARPAAMAGGGGFESSD